MEDYDSILGLYSKSNYLSDKLKEKFSDKYVDVLVFDDFLKVDYSKLSYLILNLIDLPISSEIIKILKNIECKILVLSPYKVKTEDLEKVNKLLNDLLEVNNNLGIILAPEILGRGVDFNENYFSHKLIKNSLMSERVVVGDNNFNVISLSKFASEIVKDNFSFGVSGKKLLIHGFYDKPRVFVSKYLKLKNENVDVKKEVNSFSEITPDVTREVNPSLKSSIQDIKKEWNISQINEINNEILRPVQSYNTKSTDLKPQKRNLKKLTRRITFFLVAIVTIYLLPLILLLASVGSLFLSTKFIFKNSEVSNDILDFSSFLSKSVVNINFGNTFYIESSNLILKVNNIVKNTIEIVTSANGLVNNILGSEIYVLEDYTDKISANLDKVYTDINFLQSDIEEQQGVAGKEINGFLVSQNVNISDIKQKIYYLKKIVSRSSELLGWEKSKKYLILFQNNMELRPTGGFIGSFALITLDKGRMTEMVVNDVYSADGQLKGHIDPPEPIRKYLGEANWYFRDSNWDPDFKISAEKAKWFIDKEIDQKVDGVISIDLYLIKSLLKITGPINLVDFNKTITSDNLYDTTQSEVENEFFAGSIKKASFLTSLSRNLLQELKNLPKGKYTAFFKEIYKNLEERHIQIYLDDLNSQEAITGLNYSGQIKMQTDCNLRCFEDSYALIDANLGVNKSNLFIKRSQELSLNLSKNSIHHELFINYQNIAGQSLGASGIYKNYARLILPQGVTIKGVRAYQTDGSYTNLDYDIVDFESRKDLGFYFEVSPGVINKIQIVWNSPTDKLFEGGEYRINIRKQSGAEADPLSVKVSYQDLALTGDGPSLYNTDLAKDFNLKLFVKP
ncbi:MAG TPA: DUF4012 domain-containing protein [Patescibacteria group bacterium]|nr:DUF4012 domain-containing protein [Patescibacteria group bacterium]